MRSWRRCSTLARRRQRPDVAEIEAARARLDGVARVTPVYRSETLSRLVGPRGAAEGREPAAHRLVQDPRRVQPHLDARATRSARPASSRRAPATTGRRSRGPRARSARARAIFMPQDAPMAKVDATRHYGAEVELSGAAIEDCARRRAARTSPSTARRSCIRSRTRVVIAGQGTIGLELAEQVPRGRDGRRSRSAAAGSRRASRSRCARVKPGVRIVGVQAAGTLPGGSGFTIADGIAVKKPGELTTSILDERARRHRLRRRTRRSARRSCCCSSGRSSSSKAPARRRRRAARRQGRRRRAGRAACSPAATSTRRC